MLEVSSVKACHCRPPSPGTGGCPAAGRRTGHQAGSALPKGNVQCWPAIGEDPLSVASRENLETGEVGP